MPHGAAGDEEVTDGTNAIKAAICATAPAELQWLPNPGHEPEIPEGWEFWGVRLAKGERAQSYISIGCWEWSISDDGDSITHYAIRRKPTQPSQIDAINASVQAELLQQPQSATLVISGRLTSVGETFATIITGTRTLADQLAGVASQQVTLGINTEHARWFGKYVGAEVKLTVEVQL